MRISDWSSDVCSSDLTKSTFKSNSSKGGGGLNELRFEDKAGSEEIFMHAQKDLQTRVQKNASATIGANKQLTVRGNRSDQIGRASCRERVCQYVEISGVDV